MPSTPRLPSALTAVATTLPAYAGIPHRADLGAAALLAHALGECVEPDVAVRSAVERAVGRRYITLLHPPARALASGEGAAASCQP